VKEQKKEAGDPVSANGILLSGREWLGVGLFILLLYLLVPSLWRRVESFHPGPDYRMPYELSTDYWQFDRHARLAASTCDTLLVGDSVIWGQYVNPGGTLSHFLNEQAGGQRFANLGLDGLHPAAMAGLLEHYGKGISRKKVLLHCNLLWMSSPKHDLQVDEEFHFNHPQLVPQFSPRIPCYREEMARRIGYIIERNLDFAGWTDHLQVAHYGMDIPSWTIEHPYRNCLNPLFQGLPSPGKQDRFKPIPWTERGIQKQEFAWVELETSIQWRFFRRALETLEKRGNRVFVLVGPFNEHMLADRSLAVYKSRKHEIVKWLRERKVAHAAPDPLPSQLYADASHPLREGYAQLARQLYRLEFFTGGE